MSSSNFPRRPASEGREILEGLLRRVVATVRSTPGLLLISIALGIAIWVFVTEEENPTRSGVFPGQIEVEAVNVGADVAVALVVSDDQDDVGSLGLGYGRGAECEERNERDE